VADVGRVSSGFALVRAEDGPQWCHRGLIAGWLHDETGIEVHEFRRESEGCGWSHPKLPRHLRR